MNNPLKTIFKKNRNIVIGAIHFPPLLGYPDFPGFTTALKNALHDLRAFERGGVTGIIIENNYDSPHLELVTPEVVASLTYLGEKIKATTKLPMGINVLWNDYRTGLAIAKILGLAFIRVPVFIDRVKASCGIIQPQPEKVIAFRKQIQAEKIAIFTDIHVKHSEILSAHTLIESAKLAIRHGSDGIIITGQWTGQAPDLRELQSVRKNIGTFPILIGSGTNQNNITSLLKYADATIASTSLKSGQTKKREVNVKGYEQRISQSKVSALINKLVDKK